MGHSNLDYRIEVTDDQNARLLTVTFRDAFTITGQRALGSPARRSKRMDPATAR